MLSLLHRGLSQLRTMQHVSSAHCAMNDRIEIRIALGFLQRSIFCDLYISLMLRQHGMMAFVCIPSTQLEVMNVHQPVDLASIIHVYIALYLKRNFPFYVAMHAVTETTADPFMCFVYFTLAGRQNVCYNVHMYTVTGSTTCISLTSHAIVVASIPYTTYYILCIYEFNCNEIYFDSLVMYGKQKPVFRLAQSSKKKGVMNAECKKLE